MKTPLSTPAIFLLLWFFLCFLPCLLWWVISAFSKKNEDRNSKGDDLSWKRNQETLDALTGRVNFMLEKVNQMESDVRLMKGNSLALRDKVSQDTGKLENETAALKQAIHSVEEKVLVIASRPAPKTEEAAIVRVKLQSEPIVVAAVEKIKTLQEKTEAPVEKPDIPAVLVLKGAEKAEPQAEKQDSVKAQEESEEPKTELEALKKEFEQKKKEQQQQPQNEIELAKKDPQKQAVETEKPVAKPELPSAAPESLSKKQDDAPTSIDILALLMKQRK